MSILTFDMSVSNKHNLSTIVDPFQIIPSTRGFLSNDMIESYRHTDNDNILIHMNYITRVFKKDAIENSSLSRRSLKQYAKFTQQFGPKNVLIHMPSNIDEYESLEYGFRIMKDELIDKGITVHLEIASWSKDLIKYIGMKDIEQHTSEVDTDDESVITQTHTTHSVAHTPAVCVISFINRILQYANTTAPSQFKLVFDTAHMYANGCNTDDMIYIIDRYKDRCQFIHFNGNNNYMYHSDRHVPMFNKTNRIDDWMKLSKYCASLNLICIAEVTRDGAKWDEWKAFADECGFRLVKYNVGYSC